MRCRRERGQAPSPPAFRILWLWPDNVAATAREGLANAVNAAPMAGPRSHDLISAAQDVK